MHEIVGVRFKPAGKIYYFAPKGVQFKIYDDVIVETARGIEFGTIVKENIVLKEEELVLPLKDIIRFANEADKEQEKENKEGVEEAFDICKQKIKKHKLDMKLVDVEYIFDKSKIIFYFTSEGRVDFRELVKELASIFRTRIELRQIGVRDEAKILNGIGMCGRSLCCSTFLGEFEPVSIKMAKEQNLSLNPSKISGICGRLMCCLKYEEEAYIELKKLMPSIGEKVMTEKGIGEVLYLNLLKKEMKIAIKIKDSNDIAIEFLHLDEIKRLNKKNKKPNKNPNCEDCGNCEK